MFLLPCSSYSPWRTWLWRHVQDCTRLCAASQRRLTRCHALSTHQPCRREDGSIDTSAFKIIYVAPMKASGEVF